MSGEASSAAQNASGTLNVGSLLQDLSSQIQALRGDLLKVQDRVFNPAFQSKTQANKAKGPSRP